LRFRHRAQLDQEPKRDAALVLRFERTADIAERSVLLREDVRKPAHEDDVQRSRLAGEDICHDGGRARVCFHQLRHGRSLAGDYV
jgi:hypothetical protein